MTKEAKLKSLESYVIQRLDLHGDWWGKSNVKQMFEELQNEYPTHPCWCGNQETCDCISEPNDNDFGPYWCEDENGNLVEMTKVEGSRIMSKEEVEELNKIKLPF
jgi:hypothetical protein